MAVCCLDLILINLVAILLAGLDVYCWFYGSCIWSALIYAWNVWIIKTSCLHILIDFVSKPRGCTWLSIHHRKCQNCERRWIPKSGFPAEIAKMEFRDDSTRQQIVRMHLVHVCRISGINSWARIETSSVANNTGKPQTFIY